MGPLWLDVSGYELDNEEKEILAHPTVGGVILFARNYYDNDQLSALTASIRRAAGRPILIGVDQEGGRVQRFKEGFSLIPAAQQYQHAQHGEYIAEQAGWLMAMELIAHDIDLSFAPVLDKGYECQAIGTRAFGETLSSVITYSSAFMRGMKSAGMATTGKHFPGHGAVIADSHLETPYDERRSIADDLAIFRHQIESGLLDAMMPAHVIYSSYDSAPASGSEYWLKQVLRQEMNFSGIVFSDDLSMKGAQIMGGPVVRAQQALKSGCDMVLVCNDREAAVNVLDGLTIQCVENASQLRKTQQVSRDDLMRSRLWNDAVRSMEALLV
ncbi:beta-N-acetylhexosaminidase [Vibrio palustris]|uniref:beta-N-acetylhexosaminidase n=1 Tax=Vibrio palustris TaxID=1918946 RepID=A0A1R4B8V4_9VIBR|nr:beta-N-acetylhexosaminidase [Vibrio palustris]SJL85281.1 Beta-hexosaminidase [Vibrio palustris]